MPHPYKAIVMLSVVWATAGLFAGCGEEETEEPANSVSVTVEAFDTYHEPNTLAFDLGARVNLTLVNNGEVEHSFTSEDLDVAVEAGAGESAEASFTVPTEPGSYDFFCKYHPEEMQGTVSIGGDADEVPAGEDPDAEDTESDADTESDVNVDVNEEDDTDTDY